MSDIRPPQYPRNVADMDKRNWAIARLERALVLLLVVAW